jgi:hypothetical protein
MTAPAIAVEAPRCRAPGSCRDWSLYCRVLPNGWVIHVVPMGFNVRLVIESPLDNETGCYTDGWCFDRLRTIEAILAAEAWDGHRDPPGPWKKHVTTGRMGPGAKQPDPEFDDAGDEH